MRATSRPSTDPRQSRIRPIAPLRSCRRTDAPRGHLPTIAGIDPAQARRLFESQTIARLVHVAAGTALITPLAFASIDDGDDGVLVLTGGIFGRLPGPSELRQIRLEPQVALQVDHLPADMSRAWWARADGAAEVLTAGQDDPRFEAAVDTLLERFPGRLRHHDLRTVLWCTVLGWTGDVLGQ